MSHFILKIFYQISPQTAQSPSKSTYPPQKCADFSLHPNPKDFPHFLLSPSLIMMIMIMKMKKIENGMGEAQNLPS
jgi:hypothetical protein